MFERLRLKRKGKQGKAMVTAAKKRGGERGPEGSRTTVHYDVTLRMRYEDGEEVETDYTVGGLLGTSLSFVAGEIVPVVYDPDDRSSFIVDEKKMVAEQKQWLDHKKRESDEFDREAVEEAEAEDRLPPTPG